MKEGVMTVHIRVECGCCKDVFETECEGLLVLMKMPDGSIVTRASHVGPVEGIGMCEIAKGEAALALYSKMFQRCLRNGKLNLRSPAIEVLERVLKSIRR
jgi:hypothetical protein